MKFDQKGFRPEGNSIHRGFVFRNGVSGSGDQAGFGMHQGVRRMPGNAAGIAGAGSPPGQGVP
jgi:hypothetical protein